MFVRTLSVNPVIIWEFVKRNPRFHKSTLGLYLKKKQQQLFQCKQFLNDGHFWCWKFKEKSWKCVFSDLATATQPFFIFGHGKAIHLMDLDGKNQRRLMAGVGRSIFLDFHFRDYTIYWADKQSGVIYKAAVREAQRQVINQSKTILKCLLNRELYQYNNLSMHWSLTELTACSLNISLFQKLYSDKHISGLAVDWIWNSIFWTSKEKGKIKKIDINGKNEVTLVRHLIQPRAITVDPINRWSNYSCISVFIRH